MARRSDEPSSSVEEDIYLGETSPRHTAMAWGMTLLSPGLGYVYTGQLLKGVTVNLGFLLCVATFVITFSILKFFPLLPMLVLIATWAVFVAFAGAAATRVASRDEPYILRGFNHWTIYSIVFVLTFAAPLLGTAHFIGTYLLGFEPVTSAAMYPTLQTGDVAMIDRSAFRNRQPARGDLVAVAPDGSGKALVLRVVGVPGDLIRIEGEEVFVNKEPLQRSQLEEDAMRVPSIDGDADLLAMVEENNGNRYVISVSPKALIAASVPPTKLDDDEVFVMADNRSQVPTDGRERIRDSRDFGTVRMAEVAGEPVYVAWSTHQGTTRWERIGLRAQ